MAVLSPLTVPEGRLLDERTLALAELAGGIAHDFNNLLLAVRGYAELALGAAAEAGQRAHIERVIDAADKAASLTQQLLAFSRSRSADPAVLDLNAVVTEIGTLLECVVADDVELVTVLDAELGAVEVDRSQLEQVLMNLIVNARDAMPNGGRLEVATRNVELDTASAAELVGEPDPGAYVCVSVADNGSGMGADTAARMFEPFFTTKAERGGTGLGLATVSAIVRRSGGGIGVESRDDGGTEFRVYLPRVSGAAPAELPAFVAHAPSGGETILVVEDEPVVRQLVRELLERDGYDVHTAASPAEALELWPSCDADLVISDVVMPGMSGSQLVARLRETRPDVRVLYTSGYNDDAVVRSGVMTAEAAFLQKPFDGASLARKVREVLDAPAP
jgi:CheY-like chemotaxis protein